MLPVLPSGVIQRGGRRDSSKANGRFFHRKIPPLSGGLSRQPRLMTPQGSEHLWNMGMWPLTDGLTTSKDKGFHDLAINMGFNH